jgi:hypothetical protein
VAILALPAYAQKFSLEVGCVPTTAWFKYVEDKRFEPIVVGHTTGTINNKDTIVLVAIWFSEPLKEIVVTHSYPDGKTCIVSAGERAKYFIPGTRI